MAQARQQALTTRRTVELSWNDKDKEFILEGAASTKVAVPDKVLEDKKNDCSVAFTAEVAGNDFVLIRGELVTRREMEAVRLFPDGSCQAFAVEFHLGQYKHQVQIDPWTCAQLLTGDDEKNGRRP
jgi:hypothetical protein